MPLFKVGGIIAHYGTPRHSGRYPYGSGGDENTTRNRSFNDMVADLRKTGMSEPQIAESLGMTTTQLRARKSMSVSEARTEKIATAEKLRSKGMSTSAIGRQMGIPESSVRSLLAPGIRERADSLQTISNLLQKRVDEDKFIDIGAGVENQLDISDTKLRTAAAALELKGYKIINVQVPQQFGNNKTTVKVLASPGTTYAEAKANLHNIKQVQAFSQDGGRTLLGIHPPISIDSKRLQVVHKEEGGKDADGMVFLRPGVKDLSLEGKSYGQVRILVDGTHYIKGMAAFKKDLPDGVDLQFHVDKENTGNKLDALKAIKDEEGNPFGSIVRQITEHDEHGKERVTSALNIVGVKEGSGVEGSWDTWSRNLSSQFLSKQEPKLAKQQLAVTFEKKSLELERIKSLTNPTVRRELLEKFADGADSSAVHLQAAPLPGQATKVLLPVKALKETEVYAPTFENGQRVALVRYPHGGKFEIPELTVNNKNRAAKELLGPQAVDAIGIHPKVAQRLSGADFDGDFVVVIPNNKGHVKSEAALKALKDFDPQTYKMSKDLPGMTPDGTGYHMGMISNLITDMTIKGASNDEIARAVKHSMVVIDAEKHHLDYKRSKADQGIPALMKKYQDKSAGGSSTLISKATSKETVPLRKARSPREGGPIDPKTGKKVFGPPETFVDRHGNTRVKTHKVEKLANTDDAHTLISKDRTAMEVIYADHSNRLKALANEARKEVAQFKPPLVSRQAKETFAPQVKSLNAKLDLARRNKPRERQAQIIADHTVTQMKQANPHLTSAELKKIKSQALTEGRHRTGADKFLIRPSIDEWTAIQAGAISYHQLNQILKSSDLDHIKELATPREHLLMTPTKKAAAEAMFARGYTQAEVANHLGVSLSTLKTVL